MGQKIVLEISKESLENQGNPLKIEKLKMLLNGFYDAKYAFKHIEN